MLGIHIYTHTNSIQEQKCAYMNKNVLSLFSVSLISISLKYDCGEFNQLKWLTISISSWTQKREPVDGRSALLQNSSCSKMAHKHMHTAWKSQQISMRNQKLVEAKLSKPVKAIYLI